MAKVTKHETKDGETRIEINATTTEVWEAAKKTSQDFRKENETWRKAVKIAGGFAPSMFVEPIDENTSHCYTIDKDGNRVDLGEMPTLAGLQKNQDNNEIGLKTLERILEKREAEDKERMKLLTESLGAMDLSRIGTAFSRITELSKTMQEQAEAVNEQAFDAMDKAVKNWADFSARVMEPFTKRIEVPFKQVSDLLKTITDALDSNPFFARYADEIEKLSKDPAYKDADVYRPGLDYADEAETILADTLHNKALILAMENARAAIEAQEAQQKQETQEKQDNKDNPVVKVERKDSPATIIPVDKINSNIFKMLARATPSGQYEFDFVTGKAVKKGQRVIEPLVTYSLDFNKIEKAAPETAQIVKHLTPYDKRVMVAVAALYNAGNSYFTITDIWHKMGNPYDKRPAKIDFEKISNSLKKQSYAHLVLNNLGEQKADYNYPKFHYEGDLLQFEMVTAEIDGQPIQRAVHLFREPPLVTFARDRKQITTVKNSVLESPVSKTEQNLQIDDYLIERIATMKRDPKTSRKILYKSLFEDCGITRNQSRARETIERYLKHYKATEFIEDFQAQGDCIIITP